MAIAEGALHHRSAREAVERRVLAVIDRLDVAMQFSTVDTAVASQTLHAVEFALRGPQGRDDDDYLPDITDEEALTLVRALLPFVQAARRRPGCEGCTKCLEEPITSARHATPVSERSQGQL